MRPPRAVTDENPRPSVVIRRAGHADRPRLLELLHQLDLEHARLQPSFFRAPESPESSRLDMGLLRGEGTGTLLVAEGRGQGVLGLASVRLYRTPREALMVPRLRAHLDDLVVDARWRRQGIGRLLVKAALSFSQGLGAHQLLLTVWQGNDEGQAFYRSLGLLPVCQVLCREL